MKNQLFQIFFISLYLTFEQNFYSNNTLNKQLLLICQNDNYLLQERIQKNQQQVKYYVLYIIDDNKLREQGIAIKATFVYCQKQALMFSKQIDQQYQELAIFYFQDKKFQMRSIFLQEEFQVTQYFKLFQKNQDRFLLLYRYQDENKNNFQYDYKLYTVEGFDQQYLHHNLINQFKDQQNYLDIEFIQQDFFNYLIFADHKSLKIYKNHFDDDIYDISSKIILEIPNTNSDNVLISLKKHMLFISDGKQTTIYLIQIQNQFKDTFTAKMKLFQKINYGLQRSGMQDLSDVIYFVKDFFIIKFKTFFQTDFFVGEYIEKQENSKVVKIYKKLKLWQINLKHYLSEEERNNFIELNFSSNVEKILTFVLDDISNESYSQQYLKARYKNRKQYQIVPIKINFIFKDNKIFHIKNIDICPLYYRLIDAETKFCAPKQLKIIDDKSIKNYCSNSKNFFCFRLTKLKQKYQKQKYYYINYDKINPQQLTEYCNSFYNCFQCAGKRSCSFIEDKCQYQSQTEQHKSLTNELHAVQNIEKNKINLFTKIKKCLQLNKQNQNCISKVNLKENNAIVKLLQNEKNPYKFSEYSLCTFTLKFSEEQLTSMYLQDNFKYQIDRQSEQYFPNIQFFIEKYVTDLDGKFRKTIMSFSFDQFYEFLTSDSFAIYGFELQFYIFFFRETVFKDGLIFKFLDTTPNIMLYLLIFFFCIVMLVVCSIIFCYGISYMYNVVFMVYQKETLLSRFFNLFIRQKSYQFKLFRRQRICQITTIYTRLFYLQRRQMYNMFNGF